MTSIETLMRDSNPMMDPSTEYSGEEIQAFDLLVRSRSGNVDVQELNKPVEPEKKQRSGRLIAAASFAVVAALVGAVTLLANRADELPSATTAVTPQPPTTVAPSQPFTVDEALAVADAYLAALETSDVDAARGLFASDAMISGGLEGFLEDWEVVGAWVSAQGAVVTVEECVAVQRDGARIDVTCEYTDHQYIARAVGAPPVPWTVTIRFDEDGKIHSLSEKFGPPDYRTVNTPFNSWMQANHPDDADKVDCCAGDTVEESVARGELRSAYADLWVAYLEANGCTYKDVGC